MQTVLIAGYMVPSAAVGFQFVSGELLDDKHWQHCIVLCWLLW